MAEVVQRPQRFYCHLCSLEIENVSSDFTCPLCSGGFIEELPSAAVEPSNSDDVEMSEDATVFPDINHRINDELLSALFTSMTGARPLPPEGGLGEGQSTAARTRGRSIRNPQRVGVHSVNLDNFLHDFVISVMGAGPGTPMFFMGNPGDYACVTIVSMPS